MVDSDATIDSKDSNNDNENIRASPKAEEELGSAESIGFMPTPFQDKEHTEDTYADVDMTDSDNLVPPLQTSPGGSSNNYSVSQDANVNPTREEGDDVQPTMTLNGVEIPIFANLPSTEEAGADTQAGRRDKSLKEFLGMIDDYAPIVSSFRFNRCEVHAMFSR